jgi:hypothetical protein
MKVGDLVKFKDISSRCQNGERMFPEMDGRVGLVLELRTCPSGNPMVITDLERRYLRDGLSHRGFNERYYEVVNASR